MLVRKWRSRNYEKFHKFELSYFAFLVGFDLCVLASCDHSIHTYGTFGLWGSLLAGGDVIVPKGRKKMGLTEEDYIYTKSAMPGWLYIDTLDNKKISVFKFDDDTKDFIKTNNN